MTIHLVAGRTISSDVTTISAIKVGNDQWVVEQLRGRTLTLGQALAAIRLAEVLPQPRPARDDDPLWADVTDWLDELGLSHAPLTMAGVLGVPCHLAPLPKRRDQQLTHRRRFPRWLVR
ncbi:hypothetical protein C5B73_00585 (plasmid) [Nocardia cyriacigeorgica]|nr:hypothetical protein C5B73_00585 [Nocardia cyriacigeorgica]